MKAESFSPNLTGDQSKGWTLLAVCWAFVLCALISTILRVYIRSRITRNLGWDDAVMALAMVRPILSRANHDEISWSNEPCLNEGLVHRDIAYMAKD